MTSGEGSPRGILGWKLRANPLYELVLVDRLDAVARRRLPALRDEPGLYGVLRPRGSGEASDLPPPRAIDRDAALLLLTLREPGRLPAYVPEAFGEAGLEAAVRLVADGALEIEQGGRFLSGPAALALLLAGGERADLPVAGDGRLRALSIAALRYGQALAIARPAPLALRLYTYNTCPASPAWRRRIAAGGGVEAHWGIGPGGRSRRALEAGWTPLSSERGGEGWLRWRPRGAWKGRRGEALQAGSAGAPGATYKLYLSPRPEAAGDALADLLASFSARPGACPSQLKLAASAAGLLRPDKVVAHFASFESLAAGADALAGRLDGLPVQGVPFTAELGAGGLLSWGVDPPLADRGGPGRVESWRAWVVDRLARGLLAGRRATALGTTAAAGTSLEPWRFARERLRLEGVDVDSWTPGPRLWRQG